MVTRQSLFQKIKVSELKKPVAGWLCGLALLLLAILTLMRFGLLSVWINHALSPSDIIHDGGYGYRVAFSASGYSDREQFPSPLEIYQDGTLLNKPHAAHQEIRTLGEGRYSHWNKDLFFSASDNSDPRSAQHHYQVRYPWWPANGLLYGVALVTILLTTLWLYEVGLSPRHAAGRIMQRYRSADIKAISSRIVFNQPLWITVSSIYLAFMCYHIFRLYYNAW